MSADDFQKKEFGEFVFHFDVAEHSIPLKQFVDTARSSQTVIDDFNEQLFDKNVRFEIRVKAPEYGGLIEFLSVAVFGGGATIWAFLATDIGKAFFRGLTDIEPADWAEELGKKTRKLIEKKKGSKQNQTESSPVEVLETEAITEDALRDAELLVELLIAFLIAKKEKLEKVGITPAKFRKAFAARNVIYKACIDNPEVQGLSFDRSHNFPFKRADFPQLITQIPDEAEYVDEAYETWAVETVDIIVNSPNWKRDGRKWQAATNKFQDIAFSIEDEAFWHHAQIKDIQPNIKDNMRVQWAYPAGLSKPSQVRVVKVLSYNGKVISDQLSDAELQTLLTEAFVIEPDAPDLFDGLQSKQQNNDDGDKN